MTLDWSGLLSDAKVLALLEKLVAGNIETINPTVNQQGKIVYADITDVVGDDAGQVLDSLSAAGVLQRNSEARLLSCPVHEGSMDLMPRLRCPNCNSMLVTKGTLYQHICGNIATLEAYGANCPKCGKPSPKQSLKLLGSWSGCDSCKTRSAAPNVYLYCRKFNHDFPVSQAKLVDQASYRLTAEAASDLRDRLGRVIAIARGLRARQIDARLSGRIKGASGVQHVFDIVVESGAKAVPIDVKVVQEDQVQVIAVLATYAKVLDIRAELSMLVAMPSASADSKRTAAAYRMVLVEGKDPSSVVEEIARSLKDGAPGGQVSRIEFARTNLT